MLLVEVTKHFFAAHEKAVFVLKASGLHVARHCDQQDLLVFRTNSSYSRWCAAWIACARERPCNRTMQHKRWRGRSAGIWPHDQPGTQALPTLPPLSPPHPLVAGGRLAPCGAQWSTSAATLRARACCGCRRSKRPSR